MSLEDGIYAQEIDRYYTQLTRISKLYATPYTAKGISTGPPSKDQPSDLIAEITEREAHLKEVIFASVMFIEKAKEKGEEVNHVKKALIKLVDDKASSDAKVVEYKNLLEAEYKKVVELNVSKEEIDKLKKEIENLKQEVKSRSDFSNADEEMKKALEAKNNALEESKKEISLLKEESRRRRLENEELMKLNVSLAEKETSLLKKVSEIMERYNQSQKELQNVKLRFQEEKDESTKLQKEIDLIRYEVKNLQSYNMDLKKDLKTKTESLEDYKNQIKLLRNNDVPPLPGHNSLSISVSNKVDTTSIEDANKSNLLSQMPGNGSYFSSFLKGVVDKSNTVSTPSLLSPKRAALTRSMTLADNTRKPNEFFGSTFFKMNFANETPAAVSFGKETEIKADDGEDPSSRDGNKKEEEVNNESKPSTFSGILGGLLARSVSITSDSPSKGVHTNDTTGTTGVKGKESKESEAQTDKEVKPVVEREIQTANVDKREGECQTEAIMKKEMDSQTDVEDYIYKSGMISRRMSIESIDSAFTSKTTSDVFKPAKKEPRRKDPLEEFFQMLCQCAKMNSPYMDRICEIDLNGYYKELLAQKIPLHKWDELINNRLHMNIRADDKSTVNLVYSKTWKKISV